MNKHLNKTNDKTIIDRLRIEYTFSTHHNYLKNLIILV